MRWAIWVGSLLLVPGSILAGEKWADTKVKLPEPPALWLDASRQPAAYQARGRSITNGAALDVWYDGSGHGRHLSQRVQGMQPRYAEVAGVALVRFQGKEFLGRIGLDPQLEDYTLFLVAAPSSNQGGFRALLSGGELGKNDYQTGLNVDQGGDGSDRLEKINVEGKGFSGAHNLLKESAPFGRLQFLRVQGEDGPNGIQLFVGGKPQGSRARSKAKLHLDAMTVGARYCSNSAEPPFVQGFFDGDIAEILLFDRALQTEEANKVEAYLQSKYAALTKEMARGDDRLGHLLRRVDNPPAAQMLVPGFTVRELPVRLPNLNNVRYRHDGKLVCLGYNGNVYLLSDTDGDGLEDKVGVFWENKTGIRSPVGMLLTPPNYSKGQGVFTPSKDKVSLIVDTDGDDRADKEIIVAQGWKDINTTVGALGIAMDKEGNIYFGLGTADYSNPYLISKDGKAHYDLGSDSGTIQKVTPDFKQRRTLCTGIRIPVGMAFNRQGDFFSTDQEGATWLANGNPLDELLHIVPGRHYGFPPRHPKFLPEVIDEPSVFDYAPQHQSTCGLAFNESVNGGQTFGPASWAGDALIAGESRGKLFRTKLVKTPTGYVGQTQILARLQMLTIDACVSPKGDVVVCCHSGPPDWGTGPQGEGKLYKISYTGAEVPQPLFAYAAGSREVRIPFAAPLDPDYLKNLAKQVKIEYGKYVSPGDRFETLKPPYAIVQQQLATPRFQLPVLGVQVTGDRRTLVLTTALHQKAVAYVVTLPSPDSTQTPGKGKIAQQPTIDLAYGLNGVQADWVGTDGQKWSGWLPHLDLQVSQALTAGSSEHDPLWKLLQKPGKLTFKTNLDLWSMLRPAVQPGSKLDYTPQPERVRLHLESPGPKGTATVPETWSESKPSNGVHGYTRQTEVSEGADWPLTWTLTAEHGAPFFRVFFSTNEDNRPRALPLHRFLAPWAKRKTDQTPVLANHDLPQLRGGSWSKGKALFFGDVALCGRCHQVGGQGGLIGPDLANLIHRDYDSVLRDIRFPSAALNPDYLSYVATLKNGRVLIGTLRSQGDKTLIGNHEGKEIAVVRDNIESLEASPVSIMPEGLDRKLTANELRDLLTFLLTPPLTAAPLEGAGAPPPRSRAEVEAVLKTARPSAESLKKVRIVLTAGPKDHGPGEHDYPLWQRRWDNLLSTAADVQVETADGWPSPSQWKTADLIVFYSNNPRWAPNKAKNLDAFLERGGGLVFLHWAVEGGKSASLLAERIGLASCSTETKYRHGPLEVTFAPEHAITRGFDKVRFVDESYWNLTGDPAKVKVLATCVEEKQTRPQMWVLEIANGRVFVNILGHYSWTFDDPLYRALVLRGMAWSVREPVDRWLHLATVGARIEE
ncbi:MAG: ThuA domain-containing protein [Gemmataceae bacterium]